MSRQISYAFIISHTSTSLAVYNKDMEHSAHAVDLLDATGRIIGQKPRRHIDKIQDIFHSIHVFLITPRGELVLTPILKRQDLPNLFAGQLSTPVATIRRTGETAEQAAMRGVTRELFIDHPELQLIGESMISHPDFQRLCSAFYLIGDPPHIFSKTDIGKLITISPREIVKRLQTHYQEFAPSFVTLWNKFQDKLPV